MIKVKEGVYYPNGVAVRDDSVDLDKALDYQYGTDRDPDNSSYTDDEKQRAINYWLSKTDPMPSYMKESGEHFHNGWEYWTMPEGYRGPWTATMYTKDVDGHELTIYPPQDVPDEGYVEDWGAEIDMSEPYGIHENGFDSFEDAERWIMDHLEDVMNRGNDYRERTVAQNNVRELAKRVWQNDLYPIIKERAAEADYIDPNDLVNAIKEWLNIH